MNKNKNKKRLLKAGPLNINIYARGLIRGYVVTLLLSLLFGILITFTKLSENIIPILTNGIMIIGIGFSSIYISAHLRKRGWIHGGIIGCIFVLILVVISKIFVDDYSIDRVVLYKVGMGMGIGIIGGMLGINIK